MRFARWSLAILSGVMLTPMGVCAQDMPLSQIIPEVGTWEAMKLPTAPAVPTVDGR